MRGDRVDRRVRLLLGRLLLSVAHGAAGVLRQVGISAQDGCGRFDVVAGARAPRLGETARAWLANGGGGIVLEGTNLTLLGAPRPVIKWSHETLDEFSAAVTGVIEEAVALTSQSGG